MRVGIIGAGIVGSAIAYELSRIPGVEIHIFEKNSASTWQATGAALGVLLGGLSLKHRGRHLALRQASLKLWQTLIPELESKTGQLLPVNRNGILELCWTAEAWEKWLSLGNLRVTQGFPLEFWPATTVNTRFPQLSTPGLVGAIFSTQDLQINPIPVTQALRQEATAQGVQFHFQAQVDQIVVQDHRATELAWRTPTTEGYQSLDYLVIAAGLGSTPLTRGLGQELSLQPVLGQAVHYDCVDPPGLDWPVIQSGELHLVPLPQNGIGLSQGVWVGATVEFPNHEPAFPQAPLLNALKQSAMDLFPTLKSAQIVREWQGLRPRPVNRPAPIIEPLAPYTNVLMATGHYRNGILLAPITAQKIVEYLQAAV